MPIFSRLMFQAVRWAARRGLREEENFSSEAKKMEARSTGVRGETYAYWYLRPEGYVFVAKNYTPREIKGELDLVGYDGKTPAFVEVRTRTVKDDAAALPELSITQEKQRVVVRTAQRFLAERHVAECPCRFDVLAIDNRPGSHPSCASTRMPSVRNPARTIERDCFMAYSKAMWTNSRRAHTSNEFLTWVAAGTCIAVRVPALGE